MVLAMCTHCYSFPYCINTILTLNTNIYISNRFSGTLATGLIYPPERAALLLEGGNQEFYKLKNTVKEHVTLAGGHVHFEALQVHLSYLYII